jgi:hypothetical protein
MTATTVYRRCRFAHFGSSLLLMIPQKEKRSNQLPSAKPVMMIQRVGVEALMT